MVNISVIIPCYNDGKYLKEAINSVIASTYKDYEIIIVNDASNDKETIEIINNINIEKVKVISCKINKGLSHARNYGISQSSGKYILPLDADDKIAPTYIAKAIDVLEKNENIGIIYCYAELFGTIQGKWDLPQYDLGIMLIDNIIFATAVFRRKDWQRVGGYCEKWKQGLEDYDFWLSVLELRREVVQIPETLFFYRKKEMSMSVNLVQDERRLQDIYINIVKRHSAFYVQNLQLLIETARKARRDLLVAKQELVEIRQKLAMTKQELAVVKQDKAQCEEQINHIYSSRSFKVLKIYYSIRDYLLSHNGKRR
jgi:glycosyltransferase involved in cell wall biosynthesis